MVWLRVSQTSVTQISNGRKWTYTFKFALDFVIDEYMHIACTRYSSNLMEYLGVSLWKLPPDAKHTRNVHKLHVRSFPTTYHAWVRSVSNSYPSISLSFHHEVKELCIFIGPDAQEIRASCSVTARRKGRGEPPCSVGGLQGERSKAIVRILFVALVTLGFCDRARITHITWSSFSSLSSVPILIANLLDRSSGS